MRASKLRLPESTAAHTRSFWAIASSMVAFGGGLREELGELRLPFADLDAVLRALGAGERGRHAGEVELDHLAVVDRAVLDGPVHALRLEVGLERVDFLLRAAGAFEVDDG